MAYEIYHFLPDPDGNTEKGKQLKIARIDPGGKRYKRDIDGGRVSVACDETGFGSVSTPVVSYDGEFPVSHSAQVTPLGPGDEFTMDDGSGNTLMIRHVDTTEETTVFGRLGGIVLLSSN